MKNKNEAAINQVLSSNGSYSINEKQKMVKDTINKAAEKKNNNV